MPEQSAPARSRQAKPKQPALDLGPRPTWRFRKVGVGDIKVKEFGSPPSAELVRAIGIAGVLEPVLLQEGSNGKFTCSDGRRRILAAIENDMKQVPAMVMTSGNPDLHGPAVTLETNDTASPNPIIELEAIEELMRQVPGIAAPAIAKGVGIRLKTVKDRLKLTSLRYELRDAWKDGKFAAKVGVKAATCDQEQQTQLLHRLEAAGTLTMKDVRDVKRTSVREHQRTLPGDRVVPRAIETLEKVKTELMEDLSPEHDAVQAIDTALEALAREEG